MNEYAGLAAGLLLVVGLATIAPADAGSDFMPVPVDGSLSADPVELSPGDTAELALEAIPARELDELTLSIVLPEGVELVQGRLQKVFADLKIGQRLTLDVRVKLIDAGPAEIVGTAAVFDTEGIALSKAFVVSLNPEDAKKPGILKGTDASGRPIRIREILTN